MTNRNRRPLLLLAVLGLTYAVGAIVKEPEPVHVRRLERPVYTETSWSDLNASVDAAQLEVEASLERDGGVRPILHGQTSGDNAMDHYQLAMAMVPSDRSWEDFVLLFATMREADDGELDAHRAFALEIAPLLAELRRGAQSERCQYEINWNGEGLRWAYGLHPESFDQYVAYRMQLAAYRAALIKLVDGDSEEALLIFLDCLQFARDMSASPILRDSVCGGRSLVPEWILHFGQLGGWDLFSDEQIKRWIAASLTVGEGLELGGHQELVQIIINVRGLAAFLENAQAAFDRGAKELDPSAPEDHARLLEQMFYEYTALLHVTRECAEALVRDPLRGTTRVRERFKRNLEGELEWVFYALWQGSALRWQGMTSLRLLQLGLSRSIGADDPHTESPLGQRLLTKRSEGQEWFYIDLDCADGSQSLEVILAPSTR